MIKINFVDFWPNFKKEDNYFYHLLSTKHEVEIDEEDPDLLFFSVDYFRNKERDKYLNHRCKKVFFTGENVRPNFNGPTSVEYPRYSIGRCDAALTFDYSENPKNYRFPLWAFFTDWFEVGYDENRDPAYLVPLDSLLNRQYPKKLNFCNFLFSNSSGERIAILRNVEKYQPVSCAGPLCNNTS